MMSTDHDTVRATLSAVDFPASKEALVDYATQHGADEDTVRALRALPLGDYENVEQVAASVPKSAAESEGLSSSDQAKQARHHTSSGLAEHEVEVPDNPIADELGDNRGS